MIYYYVKDKRNFLTTGWEKIPKMYFELNLKKIRFELKKYFKPTTEIPKENFVILLELRHPFIAQANTLKDYKIPSEVEESIKKNKCKIMLLAWMENWSHKQFTKIFSILKATHNWLQEKHFIFITASAEEFGNTNYHCLYANKMEWQWHECDYKKIQRNANDKRFKPNKLFICLNRRPAWHRFLTVSRLFDKRKFGLLTHLSSDSVYADSMYRTETAETHYNEHYELFKRIENVETSPPYSPPKVDEEDWFSGVHHISELDTGNLWTNLLQKREDYIFKTMKFAYEIITSRGNTVGGKEAADELDLILSGDTGIEKEAEPTVEKINGWFRKFGYKSDFKEREYEQFVWYWKRKSTGDIYRGRTRAELFRIRNDLLTPQPFKKPKAMGIFAKRWKKLVEPELPLLIKFDKHRIHEGDNPNKDVDSVKYLQSMVHIITETRVDEDLFISEKSFKPMFYKRPFLIVGQRGILKKLHQQGYKTFPNMFNETYDDRGGDWSRINAVCDEAVKWISKSPSQQKQLFEQSESICKENFRNLIKRGSELEKNLHDSIMESFKC